MGALFGSLAALSIGMSELFGRRVSKQLGAITLSVTVQFMAAVTAMVGALTFVPSELIVADMVRGAVSGVGYGVGMTCYFAGLNRSSSAIVAPVVGTLSAVIPFTYSVATGESAAAIAVAGAAIAVVGPGTDHDSPGGRGGGQAGSAVGVAEWNGVRMRPDRAHRNRRGQRRMARCRPAGHRLF